jgi:hypothetical protein
MQSEPQPALIVAILVAFPVVFVAMWSFVCVVIAAVSGWRNMAPRFALPEGLVGTELASGYAIRVGIANYRGTLSFEAAPQGLIVRVMWLFPFHAPLLVPWEKLTLVEQRGFFSAGEMRVEGGSTFVLNDEAFASTRGALERVRPGWRPSAQA